MKQELQELFDGLNKLCEETEAFYFSEQDYGENHIVRSYTYRLATHTDFLKPYARDCRGTAFVLDKRTGEWNLFCRAYRKFANLGEWVSKEITLKERTAEKSFEKLDGSLILVGFIEGKIVAKSKTSINSDHAKKAQELIDKNQKLQRFIFTCHNEGFTPVFELCGPGEFKIVLNYAENELVFLGYVNKLTANVLNSGESTDENFKNLSGIRRAKIYDFSWAELQRIQEESDAKIEGFVVRMDNGEFVKCKVNAYKNLHFLKDNISNNSNLIPLIVNDNLDDLIGAFQDDSETLEYISKVQEKVSALFNHYVVEYKNLRGSFFNKYNENRKEFAMKFKNHEMFSFVMKTTDESFRDIEEVAERCAKQYILNKCKTKTLADTFVDSLEVNNA
jgi:T4 RnlA family RNA ligase